MLKTENSIILLFGIITVLFFMLIGVIGGFYASLNTLLFHEVSYALIPTSKGLTIPTYLEYNLFLGFFALALALRLKSPFAKIGSLYLLFAAIIGVSLLKFPIDIPAKPQTIVGVSHNAVTLLLGAYIVTALFLFAYAFKRIKSLVGLSQLTIAISYVILGSGIVLGIAAFLTNTLVVGLVERIAIGAYLFWILAVAISMFYSDKRAKHRSKEGSKR